MVINRHVDAYFTTFLDGRLHPRQESQIKEHLASCDRCRDAFARFEQLSTELDIVLRLEVYASDSQIIDWWDEIEQKIEAPYRSWLPSTILPALITAVLVVTPLVFRLSGDNQRGITRVSGTTSSLPSADSIIIPLSNIIATAEPDQQYASFPSIESTQPAAEATASVPAIPAPLAPARPQN